MSENSTEWTEKYRPKSLDDILGNRSQKRALRLWATGWSKDCPLKGCDVPESKEIMNKKAVLLAGPPGIGKTSAALALAREFGWSVVEMNASDKRNKSAIDEIALSGALTEGFDDEGAFLSSTKGGKKLIILDEADNLSGREDRGGIQAMAEMIRKTKQPVVLIANDAYALQRRSSVFKGKKSPVRTLYFKRPSPEEIVGLLLRIAENEGIDIEQGVIEKIAYGSGGDVRAAVNDLQSYAFSGISSEDLPAVDVRDRELEMKEALRSAFISGSIRKAREYLMRSDEEPSSVLLWEDEVIPMLCRGGADLLRSYEHLSAADIYLSRVYRRKQYSLWRYATDEMGAALVLIKNPQMFPKSFFPRWLMSMGRSRGVRTVRKSLALKMAVHMHTTTQRALQDILPYFTVLFNRDEAFRYEMIWKMRLDEKEVGYLMNDAVKARYSVSEAMKGRSSESVGLRYDIKEKGSSEIERDVTPVHDKIHKKPDDGEKDGKKKGDGVQKTLFD